MQLEEVRHGEVGVFRLAGEFDLHSVGLFKERVDSYLDEVRTPGLLVDLSQVGFMDSSGLGALLARYRKVRAKGGRMVLVSPQSAVEKVIVLGGVNRLVPIRPTEREALELLAGGESGV